MRVVRSYAVDASWDADAHLMRAIAAGDARAFAAVHARLYGKLVRLATAVTGERESARDAVQEAFVKLWKQSHAWEPRAQLDTWMWKVTLRECLSLRRRIARAIAFGDEAAPSAPHAADDVVAEREARVRLRAVVGDLSRRDRAIVALAVDEERPYPEIAALLDMSEGACRVALHRALARIKDRMAP